MKNRKDNKTERIRRQEGSGDRNVLKMRGIRIQEERRDEGSRGSTKMMYKGTSPGTEIRYTPHMMTAGVEEK